MRDLLRKLYRLFQHQDRLLIVIDADPDSIASALALKRILWRRVASCTISPIRPITRPQNLTMVKLLTIPLVPFDQLQPEQFTKFALVDSQPSHNPLFARFTYDLIIDHHPLVNETKARFLDIRPEYGANSSIMTEYLRQAKIKPSLKLATALYYAIKTDTRNFERQTTEADIRAFHFLFKYARQALVRRIEIAELTLEMLDFFHLGLSRRRQKQDRIYCFLGEVPNPDILVILADFFLRVVEISWSIVAGLYQGKLIIIFRNDGIHKNAGHLASQAFGRLGSAGGHTSSARAEIPLENLKHLPGPLQTEAWEEFLINQVERRRRKPDGPFLP